MHSWKKKLVVSQLALACTLAITSQANAANYDTWTYIDNPVTALDWDHMDKAGTVLMNPLMILVKIIKLRWIHILSYDQMVSRKI
ncbi:hypothetical protein ACNAH7_003887, partial [Escherichia coli]